MEKAAAIAALLLLFASPLFSVVETITPSGNSSDRLQVSAFSISSDLLSSGDVAYFSIEVDSFSNTVTEYFAASEIYGSDGGLAMRVEFAPAAIAGGERQSIRAFFDPSLLAPGPYRAFFNLTYGGSSSSGLRPVIFNITDSLATSNGSLPPLPSSGGQSVRGPQPDTSTPCADITCGSWGPCIEGYKSRGCTHGPSCRQLSFTQVESCSMPDLPEAARGSVCKNAPILCTTSQSERDPVFCCLLPLLSAGLFYLVFRRKKRRLDWPVI